MASWPVAHRLSEGGEAGVTDCGQEAVLTVRQVLAVLQSLRGRGDVQGSGEAGQVDTAHSDQHPQRPGQHNQLLLDLLAGGGVSLRKHKDE